MPWLVNVDRLKKKLPSLLCSGDTSKPENNNAFMRNRYRLSQLQKRKSQRFNALLNQLFVALEEIEKEIAAHKDNGTK
jgi:hypothetical protein